MSSFENYSHTSANYDQTREAVGLEAICGSLLCAGLDLQHSHLLDAGCGTGSYSKALLPYVERMTGVDMNAGMLAQAKLKLAAEIGQGNMRLMQDDLTQLPLEAASVDGAMMNQVLHHLPDTRQQNWQLRRKLFAELARVIRPGGVFVLNSCTPGQLRQGWWFYSLIPKALSRMCDRHLQRDEVIELLTEAGFEYRRCYVPVDAILQGRHYFDAHGPEHENWRNGDSIWADVSAQEMQTAQQQLKDLHASGKIQAFIAGHDQLRLEVGQISLYCAIRAGT